MRAIRWSGPRLRFGAFPRRVGLLALLLGLAISIAAADSYKWVDKQGQVHYTDMPPAGVPYEVIAAPRAPAAPLPVRPPSTATPPTISAEPAKPAPTAPAADAAAQDSFCVDALYQITLLNERRPVFKQAADGSRRYIEDAERPAELARLLGTRDQTCSNDPTERRSQEQRADQLMYAMSPGCAEARDKLANYEDPATHTPNSQIERQRAFVEQKCRGGERIDLWRGDWIRVGR
jgi:hypothetical protein